MQLAGYRKNKSIPWLLGTFISFRLKPTSSPSMYTLLRWGKAVHYTIGVGFVAIYILLWSQGWLVHSYATVMIFGIIIGMLAVIVWFFTLKSHPLKPSVSYSSFLTCIFLGHLIFALIMAAFIDLWMVFFLEAAQFPWMYA